MIMIHESVLDKTTYPICVYALIKYTDELSH